MTLMKRQSAVPDPVRHTRHTDRETDSRGPTALERMRCMWSTQETSGLDLIGIRQSARLPPPTLLTPGPILLRPAPLCLLQLDGKIVPPACSRLPPLARGRHERPTLVIRMILEAACLPTPPPRAGLPNSHHAAPVCCFLFFPPVCLLRWFRNIDSIDHDARNSRGRSERWLSCGD